MPRLNKSVLINEVSKRTNMSKASTERFVSALQDVVMENVSQGKEVKLTGFVSFTPALRLSRIMKNPRSGKTVVLPETKMVKIRPLKKFKEVLNNDDIL